MIDLSSSALPNLLRKSRGAVLVWGALALLCLASCSGSKSGGVAGGAASDDDIKKRVDSPFPREHLHSKYVFEIGAPRGFATGMQDSKKMYWRGDNYQTAKGPGVSREFRVFLTRMTEPTTAEQALTKALDEIKAEQIDFQPGEIQNVEIGGLAFLRCDFEFENERAGRGRGFLYTAIDEDVAVSINAEEYDGGDPVRLAVAHAAAATFYSRTVKKPGALRQIPRQ